MKSKTKGFTLVEMAIVVFLIGLLGMMAIPSMNMIYKQEAKKAAESLCLDLVTLRRQALVTGETYTLELGDPTSTNPSTYTLIPGLPLAAQDTFKTVEEGNNSSISYELENWNGRKIVFEDRVMKDASGVVEEVCTIVVKYAGDAYIEIVFENLTGKYTMTRIN